jgi:AmmeMemoRadiSam system protein B
MGVHVSPYAGSWYPRQERKLNALLDDLFDDSIDRTGSYVLPRALAVVVPHAAPRYSGRVAAAAYRHVQAAKPERTIILGFSHRGHKRGIAIPAVEQYCTPLGEVAIDVSAVGDLCSAAPFRLVDESEACDHSVEIQLPFLQKACPAAAVIPLYVGELDEEARAQAAQAIARILRPGDVLIASSDLTHYGRDFHYAPFPVDRKVAARLRELDRFLIESASSIDAVLFLTAIRESGATACGHQPVSLLMRTLAGLCSEDVFEQELDYQTSGEITGDYTASVSYAALGYFRQSSFELDEAEQFDLLMRARAALDLPSAGRHARPIAAGDLLSRRAPVFVTVHEGSRLVGCLGRLAHDLPLIEVVPQLAVAAALHGVSRSAPARSDGLELEISVLTPTKLVRRPEAIRVGQDGAYLEIGVRRAVLLPQAAGRDWTGATVLDALFRKAGVTRDECLTAKPRLFTFRAQVLRTNRSATACPDIAAS